MATGGHEQTLRDGAQQMGELILGIAAAAPLAAAAGVKTAAGGMGALLQNAGFNLSEGNNLNFGTYMSNRAEKTPEAPVVQPAVAIEPAIEPARMKVASMPQGVQNHNPVDPFDHGINQGAGFGDGNGFYRT